MAQFKKTVRNYTEADAFLRGKDERKIAHNTWVKDWNRGSSHPDTPDCIAVVYHKTAIILFIKDGRTELWAMKYRTATTKQRINECLPSGYYLYQQNREWFLSTPDGEVEFNDGMTVFNSEGATHASS